MKFLKIPLILLPAIALYAPPIYAADKTFSAGEIFTLTDNIIWDNVYSEATSENWATITGPYNITVSGTTNIKYISFQNTGSNTFENDTAINHCVFYGNANVTVGTISTPLTQNYTIDNCDFRNQTENQVLKVYSTTGNTIGTYRIKGNSFYYTSAKVIMLRHRNECLFDGNVVYNAQLGNTIGSNWNVAGGHTYSNNFFSQDSSQDSNYKTLLVYGAMPGINFQTNYAYYDHENPHPCSFTGYGGSGIDYYTDNIFEVVRNTDGANVLNSNIAHPVEVTKNIYIGSGSLVNAVGTASRQPLTIKNNTAYGTLPSNDGDGLLFLSESGPSPGTITISNNLISGSVDIGRAVNSLTGSQAITLSDYNNFHNVSTPYNNVSLMSGTTNDMTIDPKFADSTRNLFSWDTYMGGTGNKTSVISKLTGINGYSSITKKQTNTPSEHRPESLIAWVRYGFTPTNEVLKGAGEEGMDIGAISFSPLPPVADIAAVQHFKILEQISTPKQHDDFSTDTTNNYSIITGQINIAGGTAHGWDWQTTRVFNNSSAHSINHWVEAQVKYNGASDSSGLLFRVNSNNNSGYATYFINQRLHIYSFNTNTDRYSYGSLIASSNDTYGEGNYKIKIEVQNTSINIFINDNISISTTNSLYQTGKNIGFCTARTLANTDVTIDNLSWGKIE